MLVVAIAPGFTSEFIVLDLEVLGRRDLGDVAPLDLEGAHVVRLELQLAPAHRPDLADDARPVLEDDDVHLGRGHRRPGREARAQDEEGDTSPARELAAGLRRRHQLPNTKPRSTVTFE
jgi:hypothetical protein